MADNTVRAKFEADASGYIRVMGEAEKATTRLGDAADKTGQSTKRLGDDANKSASGWSKMGQAIRDNSADMQTVGTGLTVVGAGITAVAGASAKFAMDWQSDWAGVQKTNDGTVAQMEQLEGDLRGLARTLPATHQEIAATAEAAGQLGVGVDDVASFSKVMIDLGETTNLSADEAATALARFSNVMGTSFADADRLGATIVGLGNNFATTEKEIVDMAQRIAPVGRILRMNEADTLAMATAMSSVGINAEAGGTAISTVMRKIDASVREGGEGLIGWAEAAGISAEDFAQKWQERPAEAMQILSQGLGDTAAAGGDVNAILADLGIKGIRESATMLSLASANDVLTESLAMGGEEWDKNTALVAEAEMRYETAESKIAIAWNNIRDAAINAGSVILPVVAQVAEAVADVAGWFANLPAPVTGAVGALTGVAGVAAAGAGALLLLAPRVMDTVDAMSRLMPVVGRANSRFPRTTGFIKNLGIAAGVAAIAIGGLRILDEVISDKTGATVQTITNDLLQMAGATKDINLDGLFGNYDEYLGVSTGVDSIGEAIDRVMNKDWIDGLDGFAAGILGVESEMQVLQGRFADIGQAMSDLMAGGQGEQAAQMFTELAAAFEDQGYSAREALDVLPAYRDAILDSANAAGISLTEQELLAIAMGEVGPAGKEAADGADAAAAGMDDLGESAEDAAASLDDIIDALTLLGQINRSEMQATADFEASIDGLTESLKDNGNTLDVTTEKGRANQAAFLDLAQSGWDLATAQAEAGATNYELQSTLEGTYDKLVSTAEGMGMNAAQAGELAAQIMGIPPGVDVESWMSSAAMEIATATGTAVDSITDWKKVDVVVTEDGTAGEVQERVNKITGKTELVVVDDDGTAHRVQERIENINGVNRNVLVDDNGTIWGVQKDIDGIKDGKATVHANANTAQAESELNHTARDRTSTVTQTVRQNLLKTTLNIPAPAGGHGILRPEFNRNRAMGGRLPRHSTGGQLPRTGLGTDKILGVSSDGVPLTWVDDLEWIINGRSSEKFNGLLGMINRDDPRIQDLAGLASGGRVSQAERLVSTRQSAYDRLPGDKDNRSAKLAAKERLNAAKAELKAAKEQQKASEKASKEAADRRKAVAEMRRDMRVDLRRGEITDAFTSGNGMSVVDRMLNMSRDENLGKWSRSLLARTSGSLEKQLTTLTKRSDALEESLKKATERRDDLLSTQQSVASSLSGEWSLGSMVTAHRRDWVVDPMNAKTIAGTVSATAARIQKFAWKMGLLRKAGFSEAVITEVSGLGTEDGIMAADILLDSSKSERNAINSAYRQLDKASMYAGSEVTKNMYAGGVNAAMGVVQGLESKQNAIEKAFADMAKRGERAFKSALGIKSPSRVMMGAGQDTGLGAILGVQSMIPDAEQAMRDLAAAQQSAYQVDLASSRVPVSAEVARYATSSAAPVIDYDRLAKAVGGGLTVSPTINGVVPAELERGIMRATFRELRAQGVPVGEPA